MTNTAPSYLDRFTKRMTTCTLFLFHLCGLPTNEQIISTPAELTNAGPVLIRTWGLSHQSNYIGVTYSRLAKTTKRPRGLGLHYEKQCWRRGIIKSRLLVHTFFHSLVLRFAQAPPHLRLLLLTFFLVEHRAIAPCPCPPPPLLLLK